ncbi:UBP-type zinc finger domain-containing protein [Kitasatospora sp. NPDC085895]|uniref:UBP-type zinc finger domain-containing protein n=1 Tax=Kitasatospora sp. NPDC085895 TaxID=3155057 RepID=UPI00344B8B1C
MAEQRISGIDPSAVPSGEGCAECLAGQDAGWWLHLRRCAECGHIGCCDSSPSQHATRHARESGHPFITSFEPGEDWFWNTETGEYYSGPDLAPPLSRPEAQASPGPSDKVPADWRSRLH